MKRGIRIKRVTPWWNERDEDATFYPKVTSLVMAILMLLVIVTVYLHLNSRIDMLETQIEILIGYVEKMPR